MLRFARKQRRDRRGNILVLTALVLVTMLSVVAFAVDLGLIVTAKSQLQRTADAAALAGASAIYVPAATSVDEVYALAPELTGARHTAQTFAASNGVSQASLQATATATVWYPALLPFATSELNWQSLASGGWGNHYAHDPHSISFGIQHQPDLVPEIVMFPGDWDGQDMPPGNFGIIQVGPGGDELTNLRRQIVARACRT